MKWAVCATVCGLVLLPCCGGRGTGDIGWRTSVPEALKSAGEQGKPVMAVFSSDRSSWSVRLDRETCTDPAVRELAGKFVSVRVDVDRDPSARRTYSLPALPTVLFMNAGGKVVRQSVGFKPPDKFLAEMRAALAHAT